MEVRTLEEPISDQAALGFRDLFGSLHDEWGDAAVIEVVTPFGTAWLIHGAHAEELRKRIEDSSP